MKKWLFNIIFLFFAATELGFAETLKFEINGLKDPMLQNTRQRLDYLRALYGEELTQEQVQKIIAESPAEIRKALQPYGYFNPSIQENVQHKNQEWLAIFTISLETPLTIVDVDLKITGPGKNNLEVQQLLANFPLKTGQVFSTAEYEQAKEKIFQTLNNAGYIKARLTNNKIIIDEKNNQAAVFFHVATGPQYYFGTITFENSVYDQLFLKRFVSFQENQVFSSQKLLELQQQLASSFYFQGVTVTPLFEQARDDHVPILIAVSPPKSQRYMFGIGYGTFTGLRLTTGLSLRRVTNTGQHFDAQVRFSEVLSIISAKYIIPGKNPLTDQWILGADYKKFSPENGKSNSKTFSVAYDRKISPWEANVSMNYLLERFNVNNSRNKNSELLYPKFSVGYLEVDDLINARFGKSFHFNMQVGSQNFLSSTSFLQAELKGKYIFSPTELSRVILRGDLGYTAVKDLNDLPLTMRFFAGGLSSVRGYQESWIGPGKYLQVGSVELQHRLYGNWTGAVFYDIGAASNSFNKGYHNGKGIGIIYGSMIGPIKLYIAKGKKYGFEFSIGPEF